MKKALVISLSILLLSACKKEYTCSCTPNSGGDTYAKANVKAGSQDKADALCQEMAAGGESCAGE